MQTNLTDSIMPDGGPYYHETDFSLWVVEPYNAITAFLFVGLGLYWMVRLSDQIKTHPFLFWMSIILSIGAVGGTLYHGFRKWPFFLFMDWVPIMLIILFTVYYLIYQLVRSHLKTIPLFLLIFLLQGLFYQIAPKSKNLAISLNYISMAISVLLPVLLYMKQNQYKEAKWIVISLMSFILAITFRLLDHNGILPMGTHFLWHIFGAMATHGMFCYLYEVRRDLVSNQLAG